MFIEALRKKFAPKTMVEQLEHDLVNELYDELDAMESMHYVTGLVDWITENLDNEDVANVFDSPYRDDWNSLNEAQKEYAFWHLAQVMWGFMEGDYAAV